MKKNSDTFDLVYDSLKVRATVFYETSKEHKCSMGKFLAKLILAVLESEHACPAPKPEVEEQEEMLYLNSFKNMAAMIKEAEPLTGKFVIRPELSQLFNELEVGAMQCFGMQGMSDDEKTAVAKIVTLLHLYKNGKLYVNEVDSLLLKS